jgi:hypothetical protein
MRNKAFMGLVAAIVAAGLLVDWHAEKVMAALTPTGAPGTKGEPAPRFDFTTDTTMLEGPAQTLPPSYARLFQQARRPCSMPPPGEEAQVILFGAYEGQTIASASVAGMDRVTYAIDVEIEPGDTPLYLVMASYEPMIWRFSGATQRVAHVALATQGRSAAGLPYAGATGLEYDQVGYATGVGCMSYFSEPGSIPAQQAIVSVKRYTGRTPTVVGGRYALAAVRLPSGMGAQIQHEYRRRRALEPAPEGFDATIWRETALGFAPNGLAVIDPEQVISAQKVEPYDVLPGQIGLAQLVGNGSLRANGTVNFTVVKPIARYPAGLNGGHSVNFRLDEGVPRPAGSPGHSCVYSAGQHRGAGAIC